MADPTNPTDPIVAAAAAIPGVKEEDINRVRELSTAYHDATSQATAFDMVQEKTAGILGGLQGYINKLSISLESLGNLAGKNKADFGAMTIGLVGATEQFKNFGGAIDSNRLGSFNEDMSDLITTVTQVSPAGMAASKVVQDLKTQLIAMGAPVSKVNDLVKQGGAALGGYAKAFLTNADNALKYQSAMIQIAAQGGSMKALNEGVGTSFGGIGKQLEHLNDVTTRFGAIMSKSMVETGIKSQDVMAQYSMELYKTPAGLQAMSEGVNVAGTHFDTLTSVIQTATGAGMNINQTFQDINKTILETGMGYEDAEKYTFRLIDVSKDLGAQQSDVRDALAKTSGAFKLFTTSGEAASKMQQGLADTVKGYAQSLKDIGVPAQAALDMAAKQTMQLGALDEAQEALISQSTGGAGGLQGALEFELLREKDPKAAFAKMTETAKDAAGGKFITKEEAVRTGQVDQYELQRKILMSGNVGMKAGSTGEADRISDMLAKGGSFADISQADKDKSMVEAQQAGKAQEQLSYTGVREANITAQTAQLTVMGTNLGTIEKAFSARAGESANAGQGLNVEGQRRIREFQSSSGTAGGTTPMLDLQKRASRTMSDMLPLLTGGMASAKEAFAGPSAQPTTLGNNTGTAKQPSVSSLTDAQIEQIQDYAKTKGITNEAAFQQMSSPVKDESEVAAPTTTGKGDNRPYFPTLGGSSMLTAGKQVGDAVPSPTTTTTAAAGGGTTAGRGGTTAMGAGHQGGPIPVTIAGGAITMNLTGVCPHCKTPITTNLQGQATNVAANTG